MKRNKPESYTLYHLILFMKKTIFLSILFLFISWNIYCLSPVIFHNNLNIGDIQIFDRNDILISHIPKEDGFFLNINEQDEFSEFFLEALLEIEDKHFYKHFGVDVVAKIRAIYSNILAKKIVSGGSTITEQWIKNQYFRSNKRTFIQKFRESNLAFYSSIFLSKKTVLRNYLNNVYFGNQIYGIKSASYVYFGKQDLTSLSESEVVTLLALLRSPSTMTSNEEYFQKTFYRIAKQLKKTIKTPSYKFTSFESKNFLPHVTSFVLKKIREENKKNIVVKTTIDLGLQKEVKDIMNNSLDRLVDSNVGNSAVYVFQPHTGDILAWQGSRNFHDTSVDGQVNVIEQKQQLGSSLKPFIYTLSFLNGAHPDNLIVDMEKNFSIKGENAIFRPLNYSLTETGIVPLKEALSNSLNISAVRLLSHLGIEETYDFMKSIGFEFDFPSEHYGLSLALGTPDLTMRNVAESFGVLANNGVKKSSSIIREINGKKIISERKQMLEDNENTKEALFHLFNSLSSKVNRNNSFGLNSILNTTIPFAVKTGTTKNFRDNWTFGYRNDLVVAVWVGNNDNTPMENITGITGAAPIWHRVVEESISRGYVANTEIEIPESLTLEKKCFDENCSRYEMIYNSENKKWLSDLVSGSYCLEDFYIQDIDMEEIYKMKKIFKLEDFSIYNCEDGENLIGEVEPYFIKPENGEVFYVKGNIPLELQKIIVKADREVDFRINSVLYKKTQTVFILPDEEEYEIEIVGTGEKRKIFIERN